MRKYYITNKQYNTISIVYIIYSLENITMIQSEAQKRAKAKQYAKLKEDPQYRKDMARRKKEYYHKNKKKHLDTVYQGEKMTG